MTTNTTKNKLSFLDKLFNSFEGLMDEFENDKFLFIFLLVVFVCIIAVSLYDNGYDQHFLYLAKSFTQGKLYFTQQPPTANLLEPDTSYYNGKHFWPLGPFPAILLLPQVLLFDLSMHQGFICLLIHVINFILLFKISKKITDNTNRSLWLTIAYMCGTVYVNMIFNTQSWHYSMTLSTCMLLAAICSHLYGKSYWWIGTFLSLAIATRISTVFGLVFFIGAILVKRREVIKNLLRLLIPIFVIGLILCLYNYYRFNSPFSTGYEIQDTLKPLVNNREYGMWSLRHYPANLYFFLFKGPNAYFIEDTLVLTRIKANKHGMSILLTSPILIWIFLADYKNLKNRLAVITSTITLLFLLGSFGIGSGHYGYRFVLDFQPYLYLLLADVFGKRDFSLFHKIVIVYSLIFYAIVNY